MHFSVTLCNLLKRSEKGEVGVIRSGENFLKLSIFHGNNKMGNSTLCYVMCKIMQDI